MGLKYSNICTFIVTLAVVHWFFGIGAFSSILFGLLGNVFGLVWELAMFVLAYAILFLMEFFQFMYYVWTVLVLLINVAYMGLLFFDIERRRGHQEKTVERFFVMFGFCILIPQVFNWLFLYETLRIYILLPINIAFFLVQLDFSMPDERMKKGIVNLVLATIGIAVFF